MSGFAWVLAVLLGTSPLIDAVKQKDSATIRALLQKRVDVNAPEGDGATALHWAAYADDVELVRLLIAAGAKADSANDLRITPLHLAAVNGNAAIITALLQKGANVNAVSETGVTPLMEASRSGSVDAVRALLKAGADANVKESDRSQTALMWAASRKHAEVARVLLDAGADVHARTRVRPLTVMLDQGPRRTVKTAKQDAKQIDAGGSTALLISAQVGDATTTKLLLGAGANVNDTSADGRSALVLSTFAGHGAAARALIDAGADVNASGAGYTALHAAALRGDLETTQALLAKRADPNARLTRGSPVRRFGSQWALTTPMVGATPLLIAATYLEVEIMRALLAAGANHTVRLTASGTTPLLAAAGVAVEKEARPSDLARWNIVDNDTPQVPRDQADALSATTLLIDAGADVNDVNEAGDTALHGAAASAMPALIQLLADRGAVLDVKNKNGQTPLALTIPRGRSQDVAAAATSPSKAAEDLLRKLLASPQ